RVGTIARNWQGRIFESRIRRPHEELDVPRPGYAAGQGECVAISTVEYERVPVGDDIDRAATGRVTKGGIPRQVGDVSSTNLDIGRADKSLDIDTSVDDHFPQTGMPRLSRRVLTILDS